jgi:hypothetical protein
MPMIIFDGKGEREFLDRLLPHIEAAGRLQDLRVIDPTHPSESTRYNPFYALDDAYQEHVNFIFRSFGLREDFFKGHQEAYLSDLVRVLPYTGKLFNVYDVLVMALDEKVLEEQIAAAKARMLPRQFAQPFLKQAVVSPAPIPATRSRHCHQLADVALAGPELFQQAPHFCPSCYEPREFFL